MGAEFQICLSKMDAKYAFRRTHIAWDKACVFSYVVGEFIDRLPFGWRSSRGC